MPMIKPKRFTARSLMAVQFPHLFRKPGNPQEWHGPSTERVPMDANKHKWNLNNKRKRFKKLVFSKYGLNDRLACHRNKLWSVVTGEWVREEWLHVTHIFPTALGKLVERNVLNSSWLWEVYNGLVIPEHIGKALDDWALTIVPDTSVTRLRARTTGFLITPREYKFKVLDPTHKSLKIPVYPSHANFPKEKVSEILGKDLDEQRLSFRTHTRPLDSLLYFHTCCAVWKKTCLENPDISDCGEFEAAFIENMIELWGKEMVTYKQSYITKVFKPKEEGSPDDK